MNDPSQTSPNAVDSPIDAAGLVRAVDPSRRRLVRSGLAGSVLLGSLVSKPVLGAEYICTVSGHASGNASAHLMNVSCDFGDSPGVWLDVSSYPSGYVRGGVPNKNTCDFGGGPNAQGTLFNGLSRDGQTLADVFFYSTSGACSVGIVSGPGFAPASLRQILDSSDASELFRLGKATIASLLNIAQYSTYPVSAGRVIEMFNAVKDGDTNVYHVDGANLKLRRLGVIEYLEKLYTPPPV